MRFSASSLTEWGANYTIETVVTSIRTLLCAALLILYTVPSHAEKIYRAEEEDGSITFTQYNDRTDLEVFIDDELADRPAEMAAVDPATVYKNLDLYDDLILDAAGRHQVSPALVKAVMLVESGFNAHAVSPKGAEGLMQLMPATARELGVVDSFDPEQNIAGGTAYLRRMIDRFNGNMDKAVAAYNAGPGAVQKHGGVPPIKETQFFVRNVTRLYDYFSYDRPVRRSE